MTTKFTPETLVNVQIADEFVWLTIFTLVPEGKRAPSALLMSLTLPFAKAEPGSVVFKVPATFRFGVVNAMFRVKEVLNCRAPLKLGCELSVNVDPTIFRIFPVLVPSETTVMPPCCKALVGEPPNERVMVP